MRIDRFLLFVLLLASSYGCSEEQPYEVEKEGSSSNSVLVKLIERLMDKGISAY
ncbi:hypothetical protein GPL11_02120 [Bacteroides xylanisolvens]|nr:hypothetical protein [Bacteroides xylanisolvens]